MQHKKKIVSAEYIGTHIYITVTDTSLPPQNTLFDENFG